MTSFVQFLKSFDTDSGKRGKQFEHFVKWVLKNDPEWATQVDEVWLWNDYPRQWGRDCGIDLVFKDKNGGTWATQEAETHRRLIHLSKDFRKNRIQREAI